ncbi:MAG: hypothetical protein DRR06_14585 [Gammaproteobacteria bacterium]|nr:MAG: hypothetical protein DRR06_14585 [Gammaproteobacteria bacterium]
MIKQVTLGLLAFTLANSWANEGIQWREWSASTFAEAKAKNRLILINVGHEGCTACRFMEENTFSNSEVIELVNANFIAIQVDSEARPDIGERYSDWAWPANAFMRPDGTQVLAFAGSRRPDRYIKVLREVIDGHAAGTLTPDKLAPYGAAQVPESAPFSELRDQVRALQDNTFKDKTSGVFESAEPLRHLLLRSYVYGDSDAQDLAKATLDGHLQQLDPTWGGMYYASFGRWSNTVAEKRLESQAAALQVYADAYQLMGDAQYKDAIDNVDNYLTTFMRSEQGTFFANQQDRMATLPSNMTMDDFYALGDKERRRYGIPTIDHAIYSDVNARIILGYVMAWEATGNQAYLDTASRAAKHLLDERQTGAGWIIQFMPGAALANDQRIHVLTDKAVPYLRTQVHFGLALMALYRATGEVQWRQAAGRVANALISELEDPELGGFYGVPDDGTPGRRKPLEDNAAAAQFLYLLGVLEKADRYRVAAERAIRASASPVAVRREGKITGNLAMALETITAGYVEFSVVGDVSDQRTQGLLQAGRGVFEPRKIVHIESTGRYPQRSAPAMYICNDERCTVPIFEPDEVPVQARLFTYSSISGSTSGSRPD